MEILNSYFTPDAIIKIIVKYRIAVASKRHDIHFLNDIRSRARYIDPVERTKQNIDEIILDLVPNRKEWIRFGERKGFKNSTSLNIASLDRTIYLCRKAVKKDKSFTPPEWLPKLKNYVSDIRQTVQEIETYTISKPQLIPEKKKKSDRNDKIVYRPIAHFKSLKDKILIGQAAKYLTDFIDNELCDSVAFAFRSRKYRKEAITHHDAIARIKEFIEKHQGKELWVAECDIKKFYDCVNHRLARTALDEIIDRATQKGKRIDKRALKIYDLYLAAFSFYHDVYPENQGEKMKALNGEFEWEEEELIKEFYPTGINKRIGVPQGGAISCLIANVIMDKVDREVLQVEQGISDNDLLYLRYCDDMVIIHTSKDKCEAALKRYQDALKTCNLLCHQPTEISGYSDKYWNYKSKAPFRLAPKGFSSDSAPWVAFVGYQIRHDGFIRIRKKTIKKEIDKQKLVIHKTLRAINYNDKTNINLNTRRSPRQIAFRVEQRLISMSVGRICLHNFDKNLIPQLSWTVGFKKLTKNPVIDKQLKELDRQRMKHILQLQKKLRILEVENPNPPPETDEDFLGNPFSYHNFILKK